MTFLLQQTLIYTVPLILVALAGVFAERSGIINLALEGIMIIGAFAGAWFIRAMQEGGFEQEKAQLFCRAAVPALAAACDACYGCGGRCILAPAQFLCN